MLPILLGTVIKLDFYQLFPNHVENTGTDVVLKYVNDDASKQMKVNRPDRCSELREKIVFFFFWLLEPY